MAYSDIQRLRQQNLMNYPPIEDMSGMGEDYGMGMGDMGMSYAPVSAPSYQSPMEDVAPQRPRDPFGIGSQQQPTSPIPPTTGPTFPSGPAIVPGQTPADPNRTPAGASPLGTQSLDEYIAAINRGYTPDFTDRDRLRKLMDAAPVREAPSFARSLAAAALSVKAQDPIKTAEQVQYAPHYRNMADWTAKAEPFYKTADLENRQNVNERTLMTNAITAKTNADRILEQGRVADEKNRISEIRAKAYAWKQMLPDWDWDTKGPTYVLKGPNGEIRDTGIKTGQLGEEDLQLLKNKGAVAAAQARGAAAVQTAQAGAIAGNRDVLVIDGITYQRNPDGSLSPIKGAPAGTPTRPGTPPRTTAGAGANTLEVRRQIQDKMSALYTTDNIAKRYIRKGTSGLYEWKPRPVIAEAGIFPWSADAVTQDQIDEYDQIRGEVDPSYRPPATRTAPATSGVGPSGTTNKPATPGGRGIGPTSTPGASANPSQERTVTKKEYSASRNQTRITYSDGTTSVVAGRQ